MSQRTPMATPPWPLVAPALALAVMVAVEVVMGMGIVQPTTLQKPTQRRPAPSSPSVSPKATEYSASVSDATSHIKVAPATAPAPAPVSHGTNHQLESVLSSCRPSLLHLLQELGVRRAEHMTAFVIAM